jgi:hypothetical protein
MVYECSRPGTANNVHIAIITLHPDDGYPPFFETELVEWSDSSEEKSRGHIVAWRIRCEELKGRRVYQHS